MVRERRGHSRVIALLLLLTATASWGASFVVVKDAVAHTPVLSFLTWRFLVASGLLVAFRPHSLAQLGSRRWAQGSLIGLALAGGYILQTFGLRYTSAAVCGFLTGLQVVVTALLAWLLLCQRPTGRMWLAIFLATAGLAVISVRGVSFGLGEALTLASTVLFALQLVGLAYWSSTRDAYGLATVVVLTVAACCLAASLPTGPGLPTSLWTWAAIAATGVVATAFASVAQMWAQSQLSATDGAIVLTTEPIFTALVAWATGQTIAWPVLVGGGLIILAMLIAEVGRT
ncbi:MAG: DMT family transporter [Acidimicrobiales bacterium]